MGKQLRPPYRLYQRGRIWHAYYSIVGQGRTRIQLRESTGRTQYDEAQQYAIKRAAELQQETQDKANGRHPTITIDKAFGRYWVEKGQYQTRPQAILLRLKQIKSFLDIEFLHELSNPVLSQYVTKRRQSVANATINRELAILSAIRNLANDFWDVETNRANPQKFKLAIPAPQINNILPDMQQAEKILEHAAPHLKPIILTALYSCMRRNNILSLKWSNLDFVNNFINIKVKDKNTVGGKNHTIPMLPELKELLQIYVVML